MTHKSKTFIFMVLACAPVYAMEQQIHVQVFPSLEKITVAFEQCGLAQQLFADSRRLVIARANEELYSQPIAEEHLHKAGQKKVRFNLTEEQNQQIQNRILKLEQKKAREQEEKAARERSKFEQKAREERVPELTKKIIELIKKEHDKSSILELTELLKNHRGNIGINARTTTNWTPLMVAADRGKLAHIQLLVEHGADINAQHELWGSVLAIALGRWAAWEYHAKYEKKSIAICRYLINNGACMDASCFKMSEYGHNPRKAIFLVRYFLKLPEQCSVKNLVFDQERLKELKAVVTQARDGFYPMSYYVLEELLYYKPDFEQMVRDFLKKWPLDTTCFL